jgi:hypothetical protein
VKGFCRVSHGRWCGSLQYSGRVKGTGVHEPHLAHPLRKVPIHRTVHFTSSIFPCSLLRYPSCSVDEWVQPRGIRCAGCRAAPPALRASSDWVS